MSDNGTINNSILFDYDTTTRKSVGNDIVGLFQDIAKYAKSFPLSVYMRMLTKGFADNDDDYVGGVYFKDLEWELTEEVNAIMFENYEYAHARRLTVYGVIVEFKGIFSSVTKVTLKPGKPFDLYKHTLKTSPPLYVYPYTSLESLTEMNELESWVDIVPPLFYHWHAIGYFTRNGAQEYHPSQIKTIVRPMVKGVPVDAITPAAGYIVGFPYVAEPTIINRMGYTINTYTEWIIMAATISAIWERQALIRRDKGDHNTFTFDIDYPIGGGVDRILLRKLRRILTHTVVQGATLKNLTRFILHCDRFENIWEENGCHSITTIVLSRENISLDTIKVCNGVFREFESDWDENPKGNWIQPSRTIKTIELENVTTTSRLLKKIGEKATTVKIKGRSSLKKEDLKKCFPKSILTIDLKVDD